MLDDLLSEYYKKKRLLDALPLVENFTYGLSKEEAARRRGIRFSLSEEVKGLRKQIEEGFYDC
jgi:hypothetical protein